MNEKNKRTLSRLLRTPLAQLQATDVQDLQAAARECGALEDVLTVTQLAQVTPQRFEAWQAEAAFLVNPPIADVCRRLLDKE